MKARHVSTAVAAMVWLASACTENRTSEARFSDDDRELLNALADAGPGGLSDADRKKLDNLAGDLTDLGKQVGGLPTMIPAPTEPGLTPDQLKLLQAVIDNTTPPEPDPVPDLSRACDGFSEPIERTGDDGVFTVRVVGTTPAVQLAGKYDWTVQVLDADLLPVDNAELAVELYMPDHDHGSGPVTITSTRSAAVYALQHINLFMGGLWEVRIDVTQAKKTDHVVFRPCVASTPDAPAVFLGKAVYVFATDAAGASSISVIDAAKLKLIKAISMPEGTIWNDPVTSPDGSRIFVNNASAAAPSLVVINTLTQEIEATLPVGGSPVHIYNPNHGDEIWTHSDKQGAFYVFDVDTLALKATVQAALAGTGHGKLLYDPTIAPLAFATNVTSPSAFPINLEHKTAGYAIELCSGIGEVSCTLNTQCDTAGGYTCDVGDGKCEDTTSARQQVKIGGTHDKAISPYNNKAYFQCSGGVSGYGIVDLDSMALLDSNALSLSGTATQSPDHRFVMLVNTHGTTDVSDDTTDVLDTMNDDPNTDDYKTLDYVLATPGSPQVRGIDFGLVGGNANTLHAFIPSNSGKNVYVVDMAMLADDAIAAVTAVDVGTLSAPITGSANRRGVMGGEHFYTVNDAGMIGIAMHDLALTSEVSFSGTMQRIAFADTSGVGALAGGGDGGGGHH